MSKIILVVLALAMPLLLIPLEQVWPYPHLIEELVKFGLVLALVRLSPRPARLWTWTVGLGLAFALSETVFYLMNFWLLGSVATLWLRMVLTGLLHVLTLLLILSGMKKGMLWSFAGLGATMTVHYLYNLFISLYL